MCCALKVEYTQTAPSPPRLRRHSPSDSRLVAALWGVVGRCVMVGRAGVAGLIEG